MTTATILTTYNLFMFAYIHRRTPLVYYVRFLVPSSSRIHSPISLAYRFTFDCPKGLLTGSAPSCPYHRTIPILYARLGILLVVRAIQRPQPHIRSSLPSISAITQLPLLSAHLSPLSHRHPPWTERPKRPSCKIHLGSHMQDAHVFFRYRV